MKKILSVLFAFFATTFFGFDGLSSQDLADKAKYIGFDGDMYTGQEDPLVEFNGNGNWFNGNSKTFTLTLNNTSTQSKEVTLFPGMMWNPLISNGDAFIENPSNLLVATDGVIYTEAAGKTITVTGFPTNVRLLTTYLNNHSSWLSSIKLLASTPAQLQQPFRFREINPFEIKGEKILDLSMYTGKGYYENNMIDVPLNQTIDDLTQVSVNILAGCSLTITFNFGPSLIIGNYITASAQKAKQTALINGQSTVLRETHLNELAKSPARFDEMRPLAERRMLV